VPLGDHCWALGLRTGLNSPCDRESCVVFFLILRAGGKSGRPERPDTRPPKSLGGFLLAIVRSARGRGSLPWCQQRQARPEGGGRSVQVRSARIGG